MSDHQGSHDKEHSKDEFSIQRFWEILKMISAIEASVSGANELDKMTMLQSNAIVNLEGRLPRGLGPPDEGPPPPPWGPGPPAEGYAVRATAAAAVGPGGGGGRGGGGIIHDELSEYKKREKTRQTTNRLVFRIFSFRSASIN